MRDSKPCVSLIVTTRNRASKLANCLRAASSIKATVPWELIIVDNGSTDGTCELLEAFVREATVSTGIIEVARAGASRARNAGIKVAGGEVLLFIDDDCYVRSDIVDEYWKVFQDGALGFAGGRMLLHDPADYPLAINESCEESRFPAGRPIPCGIVQGGNLAIRRRVLENVGGFDTRLGPGTPVFSAEDWELITRIGASGWHGGYFSGPTVSHHHGRKRGDARNRIHQYNIGIGAVYWMLINDRRRRRIYLPHILRRILGDLKWRQAKVMAEFYGAYVFAKANGQQSPVPLSVRDEVVNRTNR